MNFESYRKQKNQTRKFQSILHDLSKMRISKRNTIYLLVSVDNSGWPHAMFLLNLTAEKVIEFPTEYIATNGIPKRIRTNPGTVFKSEKFKQFCDEKFIKHVMCPVSDHRGNGKVERMLRTMNERLRTNEKIVVERDKNGISNIFFALRTEKRADGKSSFERQVGKKPNTLKSVMVEKCVLERDPLIEIEPDFSEADSTFLVREQMRGTKLEGAFKKVKGAVVGQCEHTISILPKTGKKVTYWKRDVAWQRKEAEVPQCSSNNNWPKVKKSAKSRKRANDNKRVEMGKASKWMQTANETDSTDKTKRTSSTEN